MSPVIRHIEAGNGQGVAKYNRTLGDAILLSLFTAYRMMQETATHSRSSQNTCVQSSTGKELHFWLVEPQECSGERVTLFISFCSAKTRPCFLWLTRQLTFCTSTVDKCSNVFSYFTGCFLAERGRIINIEFYEPSTCC